MPRIPWGWAATAAALAAGLWLLPPALPAPRPAGYDPGPMPWESADEDRPGLPPDVRVEKRSGPPFRLDPHRPWQILLGRRGWRGDSGTVKLGHDGRVVICERPDDFFRRWEMASFDLPPAAAGEVLGVVEQSGLMGLERAYHAERVSDGTEWVLLIRQDGREFAVYFVNHFPEPVRQFSRRLDTILADAGSYLRWRRLGAYERNTDEAELWASIRR